MDEFKPGDTLIEKDDLGIPGLTLKEYRVSRPPYMKYGELRVDCTGGNGSRLYTSSYPVQRLQLKTAERLTWLRKFHGITES